MIKNTRTIIAVFSIAMALVAVLLVQSRHIPKGKATQTFEGNVREVGVDYILVEGKYQTDLSDAEAKLTTVKVSVNSITLLSRKTFVIPSAEELAKTGGRFEPAKLPTKESPSSMQMLAQDSNKASLGVTVKSFENIYGKKSFVASEINYVLPNVE
jgi:hypothetical protein